MLKVWYILLNFSLLLSSQNWPTALGQLSLQVAMSASCVSVYFCVLFQKPRFPVEWILLVEERIANIGIPLDIFGFLQTSLICIMGELAGGGLWGLHWGRTVAVGLVTGDRWNSTCKTWYLTPDTWHLTHEMWYVTPATWDDFIFSFCLSVSFRFGIGATVHTRREIQCPPYARFLLWYF